MCVYATLTRNQQGTPMPQIDGPLDQLYMSSFKTNLGWMRAISNGNSLIRLDWNQIGWNGLDNPDYVSRETKDQLLAYFDGRIFYFTLPLAPANKTRIGKFWLDAMAYIPYGTTMTYTQFSAFSGRTKSARAAGTACANNPIPIIYPCHRVTSANVALENYGGGSSLKPQNRENIARKLALLQHEAFYSTKTA